MSPAAWGLVAILCVGRPAFSQSAEAAPEQARRPAVAAEAHPVSTLDAPSLQDLSRLVASDFRRLPKRENLPWLVTGATLSLMVRPIDHAVTSPIPPSGSVGELDAGRFLGGAIVQVGSATLTYAVGRFTGHPKVARLGADLIRAQILAQGVTHAIKLSSGRTRPDGRSLSFPSGHAAGSFASATILQRQFGWRVGVPAYAAAAYVAANRVSDKRHFPSDVVFGAMVGIVAGRTVAFRLGESRFALAPVASRGGAGVALVKLGQR